MSPEQRPGRLPRLAQAPKWEVWLHTRSHVDKANRLQEWIAKQGEQGLIHPDGRLEVVPKRFAAACAAAGLGADFAEVVTRVAAEEEASLLSTYVFTPLPDAATSPDHLWRRRANDCSVRMFSRCICVDACVLLSVHRLPSNLSQVRQQEPIGAADGQ